jgi:hypothetical protein
MPIYVFEAADGERIEAQRLIADRNRPLVRGGKRFRRLTAPESLSVLGHAVHPVLGANHADRIKKAYHRLEEKQGSRFTGCEFKKKDIKNIWNRPPPPNRDY